MYGHAAFTVILVASSVSSIGIAMFDTAMSWLMTSLNPNPLMVSAVQVATMAPMFLLTIPAGALADVVDARRLLIAAQVGVVAVGVVFAATVALGWASSPALLATSFLLGAAGALAAPAWQIITPMLVPRAELDNAIAVSNAAYNVSRAVGPALGGVAITAVSLKLPFWVYVATNVLVVAALLWWRPPRRPPETLPAERLRAVVAAGLRYARNNRDLDATLIRAIAFFPFASAYWALMPLIARDRLHDGAELYGLLMGVVGAGSVVGSLGMDTLKARLGPDLSAAAAAVGTGLALALFAAARRPEIAIIASFIAGASWIVAMTTMFVSAQVALPDWVRGRGLAIFLTAYFGAMTVGSALWGAVASHSGVAFALDAAAVGTALGLVLTYRWKLETGAALDLAPSMHWRAPGLRREAERRRRPDSGRYRIPHQSSGRPGVLRAHARDRPRAHARRGLRLEPVPRPQRSGPVDRDLVGPLPAGTQVPGRAGNQGGRTRGAARPEIAEGAGVHELLRRRRAAAPPVERRGCRVIDGLAGRATTRPTWR